MSMTWPKDHVRSESRKTEKTSIFFSSFCIAIRFLVSTFFCVLYFKKTYRSTKTPMKTHRKKNHGRTASKRTASVRCEDYHVLKTTIGDTRSRIFGTGACEGNRVQRDTDFVF